MILRMYLQLEYFHIIQKKYSTHLRFLAAYSVDPGRVIIKEGHLASCFYFILSGNGESILFIQCNVVYCIFTHS